MHIDANNHVPIYQQIVEQIRSAIAAGAYRTGEALPSQRELAVRLRVNPNTVQRAFEMLEREGLAESRRGIAMVVGAGAASAARRVAIKTLTAQLSRAVNDAVASGLTRREIHAALREAMPARIALAKDSTVSAQEKSR